MNYRTDQNGNKSYYVLNGHGDVEYLQDSTGNILNSYTYDLWGKPIERNEQVSNPFLYSGEYWDYSTDLQYLRARWYDPGVGRFINEDTYEGQIDNPLSLNLYTYAHNNPLIYNDPTGYAINSVQLDIYLQIANAEGANSDVWWQIRSTLGTELKYSIVGGLDENNRFKYLFNMATGNHYIKEENTPENASWAKSELTKMFEADAREEQMAFALLSIGGVPKRVSSAINGTTALVKAAEKMGKDPKSTKRS